MHLIIFHEELRQSNWLLKTVKTVLHSFSINGVKKNKVKENRNIYFVKFLKTFKSYIQVRLSFGQ